MSMPDKLSNEKAMTGEDCMESARLFWARLLKDSPAASFPHLPSPTYQLVCNASWEQYQISLVRRSQSPCTTATIIKAAWALLIGLHSNTNDVVTGMTLSGSGRTALVTIPFRAQFRRDQLVCDVLASIEGHANETKSFEYLSLSEIGQISPDAKIACDFRTLLLVRSREEMLPGNTIAQDDLPSIGCALALACELTLNSPSSTKVQIKATYDDSLLNKGQVQRILLQFEHIIQQVCLEAPFSRVSDVQSASAPDLEQILSWNATVPDSYEHCVHDLIVQRASMDRDQQAVCSWDGEFNYGELDDLSSELSSYLVAHASIGPEVLVPVCFEKSKWAVVAMLAVLKAGGACVPLSPTHPIARLKGIIEDLGQHCAKTILTSASSQHLFEDMKSTLVVDASLLSTLSTDSASTLTDPSPTKPTPNNVAFVITTSGSTGKPKKIILEHAAICTSARDHGKMIKLGPHSRVLQFAAYTFDISLSDMFVTLIHGGCICIPSEHDRMNNLAAAIQKFNANQVSITAAVVSHLNYQELKSLNVLVVAGEAMTREVVDRWAEHVKLINMYGPAECSIYCIGQPDIQLGDQASIIGKGVGARVWITNEEDPNVLAPIGTVGELLIEGPVLARGYLNDKLGTESSFIRDPAWTKHQSSSETSSRRFYRTGDLARYTDDGHISFVGRSDDGQIKLRGQRIEPGEVEYQLQSCLSKPVESVVSFIKVDEQPKLAAFMEIEDISGRTTDGKTNGIVGPAIANSSTQLKVFRAITEGIEKKLHCLLPGYMVPSLFIPITKIPLSISGKVDRRKLQNLIADLSIDQLSGFRQEEMTRAPPSTAIEQRLASLWEHLLKVKGVGKDDNFFQRGGDSIGAMRLVSAARQNGLSITVDAIFKNPVLSQMALAIHEDVKDVPQVAPFSLVNEAEVEHLCEESASQCKVSKEDIEDIYPCTPQQIYWIDGANTREHQVQLVYDVPPSLDVDRFRAAWSAVANAHDILRTRIIRTPSGTFNVVLKKGLDWRAESSLEAYLKEDRLAIMSLGDRLQRFCIVKDEYLGKQFFVFTANHSSYDAWSLYLLMKDRDHAYHHGVSNATGPKFNQYIRPLIQEAYKSAAKTFWQSYLAGTKSKPLIVVPEGHQTFADSMSKRDFKLLKRPESGVTTSTMIEVAWAIVISRAIKEEDVVLDILRHGRNAPLPGVMDLTAPTITAVPFLVRVKPDETALNLLRRAQDQLNTLDSYEHYGFANIAQLSPEFAVACKNSVRCHILPPLSEIQKDVGIEKGIDLPARWVELCFNLPFRVDCVVTKNGLGVEANFDKDLISPDQVNTLFDQFQSVITQLAVADAQQKIGDITLSGTLEHNSVLMESISQKSAEVKTAMLTPQPPSSNPLTGSFVIGRW